MEELHLGVDALGVILAQVLTNGNVDDTVTGLSLIDEVGGDMASFTADAAYDTIAVYDAATARGGVSTQTAVDSSRLHDQEG